MNGIKFYFYKLMSLVKIRSLKIEKIILIFFIVFNFQSYSQSTANSIINAAETHQTMEGFGAAIAWADGTLTGSQRKGEIYNYIFNDLGLDILRLKNDYRNNPTNFAPNIAEIVDTMYALSPFRPKILISSWTPPTNIKSNNDLNGGNNATLKKDTSGQYMYKEFAAYWVNSLNAYNSIGVEPDYISIQNEPSYDASWESCRFEGTENSSVAGYNKALDSVYMALQQANLYPKILVSEVHGIGFNAFQNYANNLNSNHYDGYAYHLYHGDGGLNNTNPDAFNTSLTAIGNTYTSKPIFQTEFDRGDWFQTVWLIHNCLVNGNVSGYLYWQLVWGNGGKPLIQVGFTTYLVTKYYWAFRQYSKFVDFGWKRISASVDSDSLRVSAFLSPDSNKLSVVILNIGTQTKTTSFDILNHNIISGKVIRTSETENGIEIISNYNGTTDIDIPPRSITTIAFTDDPVGVNENEISAPTDFVLRQNYPNPFNPSTTINYYLLKSTNVKINIYNVLGVKVKTLQDLFQNPGEYSITWDATNDQNNPVSSGVYLYRLETNNKTLQNKMVLIR